MKARNITKLVSKLDKSVNWIQEFKKGSIETRFVRKKQEYIVAYLSSHSGCKMGCKFCFLTQQKQTTFDHVTIQGFSSQLNTVLEHYKQEVDGGEPKADRVNINFMARGEALANKYVISDYTTLFDMFEKQSKVFGLKPKVNISTILPLSFRGHKLEDIFKRPAHIYYSLYSLESDFRKEWLPNAMPVMESLELLKRYEITALERGIKYPVVFHWSLIEGKNDSVESAKLVAQLLKKFEFQSKFNLVRYNLHPKTFTVESKKTTEIFQIISEDLGSSKSYIVPRVGFDVNASCGMFLP